MDLRTKTVLVAVAAFLAGVAVSVAMNPRAEDARKEARQGLKFSVASGECRYQPSPDGMFRNHDEENASAYKDSGCGEIELSGPLGPTFGWALRWVSPGRAHTRSNARTLPADSKANFRNIDTRRAECSVGYNEDNCLYQWFGDGGMTPGPAFALNWQPPPLGPFSVEPEIGLFLYRMKWSGQVYPQGCVDGSCPWRGTSEQESGWLVSPEVGFTLRYKISKHIEPFIAKRYYFRTTQHQPVTAGISGPLQVWLLGVSVVF